MINEELVRNQIAVIGGFDDEELNGFGTIIAASAAATADLLKSAEYENDPRIINLAAAKAYCSICCTAYGDENFASFTAGDVSLTQGTSDKSNAEKNLALALSDCSAMIADSRFAFMGV